MYDWKRFWYPKGGTCRLDFAGYLDDPESSYAHITNPEVVPFEAIAETPCLVLLGEPGSGKSTAIHQVFEQVNKEGKPALKFELGDYDSSSDLCNALFGNQTFYAWLNGMHQLNLFLDSLDEGLLSIRILSRILSRELKKYPCERLQLRITCRTADWQTTLEEDLRQLWGKDNLRVYELAPLRQGDVQEAAQKNNLDAEAFLSEIQAREAAPLAIQPITLKFLLKIYQGEGQFPSTRKELYYKGCRKLCDENNSDRCDAGIRGSLTADERMMVAARIAAVIVFANRAAVWTGSDDEASNKDATILELCGADTINGHEFCVTEAVVREVLKITSLFSFYGDEPHRFCFIHQTYAEFLAAWYLDQHLMTLAQIMSLLQHPADPDKKLVPQLNQVAAWMASMMPEVFREIVKTDPDVLLQSDIATATDIDKATLVESLLQAYDEEQLPYSYRFWQYQHLNYPKLSDKLREYIVDSRKHQSSRLTAIDIARACNIKAVQSDLVAVALDSSQPYWIRINATNTLGQIGDEENKARLKPLAIAMHEDDPDDYLKGYALKAIFPQHIPVEELLDNITQPKSQWIGGAYSEFIASSLAEQLPIQDLPVILRWLERQLPVRYDLHYPFRELADSVMLKAWQNWSEPGVLEAFANVAKQRLKQHEGILGALPTQVCTLETFNDNRDAEVESFLKDSTEKRQQLIETIVSLISAAENDCSWLIQAICSEDIVWLINNATSAKSNRVANIWIKLSRLALTWHNLCWKEAKYTDAILKACDASSEMRAEFEFDITPLELGSERAEQVKTTYLRYQLQPRETKPLLDPPPKQRVIAILEKVEAGQPELWWQVCLEITLTPTSTHYNARAALTLELTTLPGWLEADTDTKARIIKAAKEYIDVGEPETQTWLGTNNFSNPPFAGYQALYLLSKQEPVSIAAISSEVWIKWIPVVLHFINSPFGNKEEKDENYQRIVRAAYQNAPDEFIETLIFLMNSNNYRPRTFYPHDVYRLVSNLLDEPLPEIIINKVGIDNLQAGMLEILLADFFTNQINKAKSLAVSLVSPSVLGDEEARARAAVAARMLVLYPDDSSWLAVWSAVQQDREFGREVLESVALQAAHQGQIEQQIKEEYLANLYIFLAQEYPDVEDYEQETKELRGVEAQIIGESDEIRMWKSYIPQRLQERGTPQACEALRQIIRELPELKDKLQWRLLEAEALIRRQTWSPPTPQEVLKVTSDQNVRLVNGADQLLDVVVESLDRLNQKLQGETPSAIFLWNQWKNQGDQIVFRPKDEQVLSDYIKLHLEEELKQRGITIKREPEIRRRHGDKDVAAPGERVDLQVDAFVKLPNGEIHDCVSVIIEVKGCWNKYLDTAMQTQLVDRYLKDNSCQHGLYLIGWFNCKQWDRKDSRKPPKMSIEEARQKFETQAAELSKQGVKVKAVVLNTSLR